MSVWGLIILGLVRIGSLGFAGDPLVGGVSFRLGAVKGFRGHLILSFGSGENRVDSIKYIFHRDEDSYRETVYEKSFWRPYSWINLGVRAEYYFTSKGWYQPYIGIGVGWKKDSRWVSKWEMIGDTVEIETPELTEINYLGPVGVIGVDFYPLPLISKFLKFEIPFAQAISFNIEICPFYLFKHEFKGDPYGWRWFPYYSERKFSGVDAGAGIHFNF